MAADAVAVAVVVVVDCGLILGFVIAAFETLFGSGGGGGC